jgi:fatty-acyl-CoA synthase
MDTIGQMLLEQAARLGERVAIHDAHSQLSYRALTEASLRVAACLVDLGVAPGDRIALLMPPSTEWVAVHYGIMAAGAIAVPLNLAWQAEELSFALRQARVSAVVLNAASRGRPLAARLFDALNTAVRLSDDPNETAQAPRLRFGVMFGHTDTLPAGWRQGTEMLNHVAPAATEAEVRRRIEAATPRTACCMVYTSGSTGRPKPAVLHHFGLLQAAWEYGAGLDPTAHDRVLAPWPTFHVSGITAGMMMANLREAPCWLMESYDPGEALRTIEREGITTFLGFDTTFTTMITRADFSPSRVASMQRMLLATGPAMYDRVFKAFPNLRLGMKCYAMTETCGPTALMYPRITDPEQRKYGHGAVTPHAQIRVCDPQTGQPCAIGVRGEIRLRGPLLFDGYEGMPQQTRDAFDSEGWFCTGDLGWFDAAGVLFYDGRLKRMIKTGGENVSEREVESFLEERVPGVNIAQVVGIPDAVWGEAVVAFLEPLQGAVLDEAQVRALCKGRIADYKIPKRVWVLSDSEWPRNEVGKISKDALVARARAAAGS